MHFHRLDLNLLVALDAILAERNITRAAERLHLSQPALSGALGRLREYFGDDLLVQVGRRMVPTPLAESLIGPVREILLKVETTIQTKPGFDPSTSQRNFRIQMSDYVSIVLMTQALPKIQRVAPHITFELLRYADAPWEALDRGEIDFLVQPINYFQAGHPNEPLFDDSYTCIAWRDNPHVGERITMAQYLELGHVVMRFGSAQTPAFDEWFFEQYGHTRRVEVVTSSFSAIPPLVVGTTRIATVHQRLAKFFMQYLPLKEVAPPLEMPILTEAIAWHRYWDHDQGNLWLRRMLKAAMSDPSAQP